MTLTELLSYVTAEYHYLVTVPGDSDFAKIMSHVRLYIAEQIVKGPLNNEPLDAKHFLDFIRTQDGLDMWRKALATYWDGHLSQKTVTFALHLNHLFKNNLVNLLPGYTVNNDLRLRFKEFFNDEDFWLQEDAYQFLERGVPFSIMQMRGLCESEATFSLERFKKIVEDNVTKPWFANVSLFGKAKKSTLFFEAVRNAASFAALEVWLNQNYKAQVQVVIRPD